MSAVWSQEPHRREIPLSLQGLGDIVPADSHIQVVEQGLQLLQGEAVTFPVAMHEVLQERGRTDGGRPRGHRVSLGSSCP